MKIGVIGLGNMATAIVGGLLAKGIVAPEDIIGYDKYEAAALKIADTHKITVVPLAETVAKEADILFLAVKPNVLEEVFKDIKESISEKTTIISIVAGKTLAFLEAGLGADKKIVRTMPNTPALVLEGCTGVCPNANVTKEDLDQVMELLGAFSRASIVPEKLMDVVVGVSGSSPAYVFLFIEAMADAAVAAGMPRAQAYEMCAQAVMGSAKLMLETKRHPGELKDMVCSPGGTTIDAVKVLEEKGFRAAVIDATLACIEKSKKL